MDWTERRERFRSILNGSRCLHPASVYDAMSARIAEDLGYEVGMLAGSTGSLSVLGAPDLIVLTLTEFAAQCYRVCRAGNVALMVDADHGYGNALNVKRTVEELETAGVSALTIEDTILPRPYGATQTTLISIEEGVGKMRAALAGRQDPRLVIAGRTSALQVTGVEDAIARCQAYESAGVDALFLAGASKKEQIEAISQATTVPLMIGGGTDPIATPEWFAEHRVKIVLLGHQPIAAAVQAVYTTMKALRDGTLPSQLTGLPSRELMARVTRADDYEGWTKEFLNSTTAGG
jgi:oxaloacetate decarboxylase